MGGTKGKVLTTSVAQIHLDFGLAVEAVKNVDYDVMDLDAASAFEDNYQTFRSGFFPVWYQAGSAEHLSLENSRGRGGRYRDWLKLRLNGSARDDSVFDIPTLLRGVVAAHIFQVIVSCGRARVWSARTFDDYSTVRSCALPSSPVLVPFERPTLRILRI